MARTAAAALAFYAASGELSSSALKSGSAKAVVAAKAGKSTEESSGKIVEAYVQVDQDSEYAGIGRKINLRKINRLALAFANLDNSGDVYTPAVGASVRKVVGGLAAGSQVTMAIGGWGANKKGWNSALNNPARFIKTTETAMSTVSREIGRKVSGVDIDFEYPTTAQSARLVKLVQKMRKALPGDLITMAIPPSGSNLEGFNVKALSPSVNQFEVMAYDYNGPWSTAASDIAPGQQVIQDVNQMVREVGDPGKIVVGFPGYGYEFVGAKKPGDTDFKSVSTIPFNMIPKSAIVDDEQSLTSSAIVNGNWTTIQSPNIASKIYGSLTGTSPNLGGAFYWELGDLNESNIDAISAK